MTFNASEYLAWCAERMADEARSLAVNPEGERFPYRVAQERFERALGGRVTLDDLAEYDRVHFVGASRILNVNGLNASFSGTGRKGQVP